VALINPLRTIFLAAEAVVATLTGGGRLSLGLGYPRRLGAWSAAALFFGFAWLELIWGESDIPAALARVVLIYSLISWAGMFLFGREVWLRHGEAFTIAFAILARFAVLDSWTPTGNGGGSSICGRRARASWTTARSQARCSCSCC
jgi:hypothetical protein